MKRAYLCALGAALALSPVLAFADTTVHTLVFNNGGAGYPGAPIIDNSPFSVPQHDEMSGARPLIKVTADLAVFSRGGRHWFDNEVVAPGSYPVTVTIGSHVDILGPPADTGPNRLSLGVDAVNAVSGFVTEDTDGPGAGDGTGTDAIEIIGTSSSNSGSTFRTASGALTPYKGTGLAAFVFDAGGTTAGSILTAAGTNFVDPSTNFDFVVTITYEWTPEPGSLSLLLVPLALLGRARRR